MILQSDQQVITVIRKTTDEIANQDSINWALGHLAATLEQHNLAAAFAEHTVNEPSILEIRVAGTESLLAEGVIWRAGIALPSEPEAFILSRETIERRTVLVVCGYDVRGLVYAILELADRIRYSSNPILMLGSMKPTIETQLTGYDVSVGYSSVKWKTNPGFTIKSFGVST